MSNQIVTKLAPRQFRIEWNGTQNSRILMDFTPIIKVFNLKGNFALLHWQAKPFGLRRWGIYTSFDDEYHPFDYHQLHSETPKNISVLQIDENKWKTKPTAVIYVPNSKIVKDDNRQEYLLLKSSKD